MMAIFKILLVQDEVEHQAAANEALVACATKIAREEQGLQEAKKPDSDLVKAACMHALKEHIILCHKLKCLPKNLGDIQVCTIC